MVAQPYTEIFKLKEAKSIKQIGGIQMEALGSIVKSINNVVWSTPLLVLCSIAGIFFSVRMKFPQVRLLKEMVKLLTAPEKSESGVTPFQAFATTVGGRVGVGNIAGVAAAIYYGGPGAVFWMWFIAFLGAGSAFAENKHIKLR